MTLPEGRVRKRRGGVVCGGVVEVVAVVIVGTGTQQLVFFPSEVSQQPSRSGLAEDAPIVVSLSHIPPNKA